jgi:hypothetical protein
VLLGNRGGWIDRLGRCLLVWASGSAAFGTVALLVRPAAAAGWSARRSLAALPLDRALVDLAAGVMLGCAAWAWLALTVTVVEALRGVRPDGVLRPARPWHLPSGLRRLVLAGCGLALVSGITQPALAAGGSHHRHPGRGAAALTGLPLPDRAVAPPSRPAPRRAIHAQSPTAGYVVVRSGECLWSIAARALPPDAPATAIATRWRAIYAANRGVIGPDPDVLEPGQRLLLRRLPRKDPS